MYAISVRNPWALWIAWGWKPIETRTSKKLRLHVGKRIAIHASKLMDPKALSLARPYLTEYQWDKTHEELGKAYAEHNRKVTDPRFGAIICTAFAEDHRKLQPAVLFARCVVQEHPGRSAATSRLGGFPPGGRPAPAARY